MKIFFNISWFGDDRQVAPVTHWVRDPLAHPDIQRMSQREIADLPFRNSARRTDLEMACPASSR